MRVDDNLAGVVAGAQALTDQLIETELLGTGHFDRASQWRGHGEQARAWREYPDVSCRRQEVERVEGACRLRRSS